VRARLSRRWLWAVGVTLAVIAGCLLVLVLLGPSAGLDRVRGLVAGRFPDVHRIDAADLAAAMSADGAHQPLLLDTRTEPEFAMSHLRGAIRFDPRRALLAQVGDRGVRRIVVYCSVGYRSAIVARSLAVVGVRDVQNLDGGIFAWANAGRAVYRGGERVREVHPYDAVWGLLLRPALRASTPRR
jgi:rhodanese-related sulfurtransferase